MKKNTPIVEAEIKILKKFSLKCFIISSLFHSGEKNRGKRSNILTRPG